MSSKVFSNKETLQAHLNTFNIYDLQRLLQCFQYELTLKTSDKDSVKEIIECIQFAIAKVES